MPIETRLMVFIYRYLMHLKNKTFFQLIIYFHSSIEIWKSVKYHFILKLTTGANRTNRFLVKVFLQTPTVRDQEIMN